MKLIKQHQTKIVLALLSIFVFMLFFYITKLTPLAGDDWGYAVLGRSNNPFVHAFKFYFSWSGRYFSELWGFIVAPRKWLWNILNPLMFTIIFISIISLINAKKNKILVMVVILGLMLSVQNTLRIETYTWIMGSTYVVPLMMLLIYLNIIKPIIFENKEFNKIKIILSILLNIYITLCMENVAAILVLLNILVIIFCYFNKDKNIKKFIVLLIVSIIGIIALRISPGSTYRLYRDNQEWLSMSIFQQISLNWKSFLNLTFIKNNYMLFGLGLSFSFLNYKIIKENKKIGYLLIIISLFTMLISILPILFDKVNIDILRIFFDIEFSSFALLFTSIFYPILVISLFVSIWIGLSRDSALEASLYIMLGGSANLVMLISPIFGDRSSLYTVYFIFILIGFIISSLDIGKFIRYVILFCFVLLIGLKTKEFMYKYQTINSIQQIRNGEIEYYVNNPDSKEAWLIRMPKGYIHSADIEEDDIYHMDVFKQYYGINPEMKLIFYNK